MKDERYRQMIIAMVDKLVDIPADNYTQGRGTQAVDTVVVHVMDGWLKGTDGWFANSDSNVSAHFGIGFDGTIHQYVNLGNTAWHAGSWKVNQRSVGIEHEGRPNSPELWNEKQLEASAKLAALICLYYGLSVDAIKPHSQFNPGHRCPGDRFPWPQYRKRVSDLMAEYAVQADVVYPKETKAHDGTADTWITMPLYYGTTKMGRVRFQKGTAKAYFLIEPGLKYPAMQNILKALGFGKFKYD